MADLLNFTGVRVLDSNAAPGSGYVAKFYESGTTTPITVYTTSSLGTPHGTSVTADSQGKFAAVWTDGAVTVKCVIEDANGAVVQTVDPVFSTPSSTSAASEVTFTPTVDLPYTNVQDAIEGAAASAASGFATYGIGITGNATLLSNLDATNIGAGTYRFANTTTGTYPTGVAAADTGLVETWRQAAGTAMMMLYHATTDRVFHRRMASSAWGTWREVITSNQAPAEGDILYRSASAWTRLAKGTASQQLRMNAGATAPEWFTASNGITLIDTKATTSGASVTFSSLTLTGYKFIRFVFAGVSHDSVSNQTFSVDGVTVTAAINSISPIRGFVDVDLTDGTFSGSLQNAGTNASAFGNAVAGDTSITTATTSIAVAVSAGAFDAGSIRLYGMN